MIEKCVKNVEDLPVSFFIRGTADTESALWCSRGIFLEYNKKSNLRRKLQLCVWTVGI